MRLTPEQREAVQKKLAANILSKLNRGETITAREQAILDGQADPRTAVFVRNWDDLARELNVSRKSLQNWRGREDLRAKPDFPRPRADNRHDPEAWRAFMIAHGLNRADEGEVADVADADGEQSKAYWDRRGARIDYERKVYNLEVEKQKHLEIDEITTAIGQMLAGFRTALNTLPTSAARWLIGMRDFNSIKNKLQEEVDAVLQALGRCDYLQELTASVVAQMFADRDDQSRQDLSKCVDAVHRELGRLALSDLLQRALPAQTSEAERPVSPNPQLSVEDPILRSSTSEQSAPVGKAKPPHKRRTRARKTKAAAAS